MIDKEKIYYIASVAANAIFIIAILLLGIYLIAPLMGGQLLADAVIKYASWVGIALAMKLILNRLRKKDHIRAREYILLCLVVVANTIAWFPYPLNLIIGTLGLIGIFFSYRAGKRAKGQSLNSQ